MSPLDALYLTVHVYPGGAAALAPRLGKAPTTLCHELAPPAGSTAKLGLMTADLIMGMTGDLRCLDALNARHGRMSLPLPVLPEDGGADCVAAAVRVAATAREVSDLMGAIADSLRDGRVTDAELAEVRREWGELLAAGGALLGVMAAMNEQLRAARAARSAAGLHQVA